MIALEPRKRSLARTNPPEIHKAHCRVTVTTVKITELMTARAFHVIPGRGVIPEMEAVREELAGGNDVSCASLITEPKTR